MHTPRTAQHTALLTVLHLLVDGLCACSVFMLHDTLTGMGIALLFVGYNVLAFMTQPIVGAWMDNRRPGPKCLWAAVLLLFGGALLTTLHPFCCGTLTEMPMLGAVAALLGMGNSLFHVYAGKHVTEITTNDPRHLGVFVSSGALGLALGGSLHSSALMVAIAGAMLGGVWAFLHAAQPDKPQERPATERLNGALLLFMLLLVFGRSLVGNLKPDSVQGLAHYAAAASVLAFAGKASGGFIAQRLGVWTTLTAALMASGVAMLLSGMHWAFALLMVLCINVTMPLTLHLANRSMPRRAGLAFGALACMLIPGHALGLCLAGSSMALHLLYPLVATIIIEALVLLTLGERRWTVLGLSVAMNVLTNVPLNCAVSSVACLQTSLPAHLLLEVAVFGIEAAIFCAVLHDRRRAAAYSLACNATSYLCGVAFSLLLSLIP